ncbi:MAG: beta strand repeat-containing protein [Burkholderiaceae bacterium]
MSEFRPASKTSSPAVSGADPVANSPAPTIPSGELRRVAGNPAGVTGRRGRDVMADAQRPLPEALFPVSESPAVPVKTAPGQAGSSLRARRREDAEDTDHQISLDFSPIEVPASVESASPAEGPILFAQAANPAAVEGAAAGSGGAAGAATAAGLSAPVVGGVLIGAGVLIASASSSSSTPAATGPAAPAPDTTPPQLVSTAVSSTASTVTLTFDSTLDAKAPPLKTAFTVAINDAPGTVPDSIKVEGNKVVLSFATGFIPAGNIKLALTYTDAAGDGALTLQDEAGNDAASFSISQGVVADGYIRGAQIYVDANNNGVAEASEMIAGVVTDAAGRFFLPSTAPKGTIIAVGGVNIDTGLPNTSPLKAPAGSTTINPLTTLVQAVIEKSGTTAPTQAAIQAAANQVAATLGLPESVATGGNLLNFDPLSVKSTASANDKAAALAVQKAAANVATVVALAATDSASATKVVANLATTIASTIQEAGGQTLRLDDVNVLNSALKGVNVSLESRVSLAEAVSAISATSSIDGISNVQSQVLDKIAPDKPEASVAARSRTATPEVKVSLNTQSTDGKAVVVGDVIRLIEGGVQIGSATITEADLAVSYKNVVVSAFPLSEGNHSLQAQVVDKSGNVSALSAAAVVVVDLTPPKALISNSVGAMAPGGTSTLTISLSEAVEGFTKDDILIPSGSALGTLSAPTVSANGQVVYTIGFTAPTAQGAVKVSVGTVFTDLAGNAPAAASPEIDLSVDAAPTAIILDNTPGIATGPVSYTISFSERVNGFDLSDLTVTGGTPGSLATVSASQVYSFVVTPEANASNITVQLKADAVTDIPVTGTQGKPNLAVSAEAQPVDTQAPTVTISQVAGDDKINATENKTILDNIPGSEVVVAGTASEAGVKVSLQLGAGNVRAITADANRNWSYKLTPADIKAMGQGAETIIARATDAAGNTTSDAAAAKRDISIGTVVPTLTAWTLTDASDTGVKGDGRTSVVAPTISFAASNNLPVTVQVLNASTNAVVKSFNVIGTGADQTLVLADTLSQAVGTYIVKLSAADTAGGNSVERSSQLVFDASSPSGVASDTTAAAIVGRTAGNVVFQITASEPSLGLTADEVTIVGGKASGAVRLVGGNVFELAVTPDADLEGDTAGRVTVSVAAGKFTDLAGNQNTAVSAHFQAVDTRNPRAGTLPAASIDENNSQGSFVFAASDRQDTAIAWSIKSGAGDAALISINPTTGEAKLTAAPNFEAKSSYSFVVVAADAVGNTTDIPYTITVRNLDEQAPVITSLGTGSIAENASTATVAYKVTSTDTADISTGSTAYSLKAGGDASAFSIDASSGEVRLLSSANFEVKPSYQITVVAKDTANNSSEKVVAISVTDINEDPSKTSLAPTAPLIVVVDQPLSGATVAPWFTDPDGGSTAFGKLTYSVSPALPAGLQLNKDTGAVTGSLGSIPDAQVTFTATDGGGRTVSHQVTVQTVTAPVIRSFTASDAVGTTSVGKQGEAVTFTLTMSEPVTVVGSPQVNFVAGTGQPFSATYQSTSTDKLSLVFTANAPAGDGTLKISSINLNGATVTGDVSKQPLVLTSVNQTFAGYRVDNTAPVVDTAALSVAENLKAIGQVLATDAGPVKYTLGSGSDAAQFEISETGALSFIAQQGKNYEAETGTRTYTVPVIATDAAGTASAPKSIVVTLTDVDEFDVTKPADANTAAANTIAENSAVGSLVGVTASASDADGTTNTVTYKLVTAAGADYTGTEFAIGASTGVVSVAGPIDFEAATPATRTLYVKATSADNSSQISDAIVVAVTNVNEAPVKNGDVGALTAVTNQPYNRDLATFFKDPDGSDALGVLTYTRTSGTLPSGLSLSSAGVLSGTATADASPVSVTVRASDSGSLFAEQTFTLGVVSAPVLQSFTVTDPVPSATIGKSGDDLTFVLKFTEAVNVTGTPKVTLKVMSNGQSATTFDASYSQGTGTDSLTFTAKAPNASGTFEVGAFSLASATIVGNVSKQPLVATSVGQVAGYTLDSKLPTIQAPSSTTLSVAESATKIADLSADEQVTWSVTSSNAAAFAVSGAVLSFAALKDFEVAADRTTTLTLAATDLAGNQKTASLTVNLTDVNEFQVSKPADTNTAANTIAENATAGTAVGVTAVATDADGTTNAVTYKLVNANGTDYTGTEFAINSSTGVVTAAGAINFEASATTSRTIYVRATSADTSSQVSDAIVVAVTDVNEAPTVVASSPTEYTVVVGQALANASVAGWFSDPDASTSNNGKLTYSAKPTADMPTGLPSGLSLAAATGAITGTVSQTGSKVVTIVATDGGNLSVEKTVTMSAVTAPTLAASALDGVTNLDPTSNIVLKFSEAVNPAASKFIRLVNDANSTAANGFRTETATNSIQIEATSSQVTFSADKKTVIINPTADLDLANNFHVEIDAGAFIGVTSLQGTPVLSDPTVINFSTVVPKSPNSLSAPVATDGAASQIMATDGTLAASRLWLDIEGLGSPSAQNKVPLNIGSTSSVAMVAKDYDPTGATAGGYDGIKTGDIFLAVTGFSADDLLYIDNQSAVANGLDTANISNAGSAPSTIQFAGTGLGGIIDITIANSTAAFDTVAGFKTLLQLAQTASSPVISA